MRTDTVNEYEQEDYSQARENMSSHEAALLLEKIDRGWIPGYDFTVTQQDFDNYRLHVALDKAIKALV